MTHLRIELNNIQENVSSAVILKLYELATSGDLDLSSNLAGNLHTTVTYLEYIDALHTAYPELYISATGIYIMFEDPEVLNVLLANNIGDGVGVTMALASSANIGKIFKNNTTITSFNEFNKFTSLNYQFSFENCSNLKSIKIPNSVTYILDSAFDRCTKLASIDFGTGVTGIGKNAFSDTSITSILLPIACRSIGLLCFGSCTNLSSIDLSHILTIGGQGAFSNCTSLISVDLSSLTTPSYEVFAGCTSLLSVIWPTTANIGYHYFDGCTSLTTVIEPGSSATGTVTLAHSSTLGEGAFKNCSAITTVDLSNSSITKINKSAFLGCTNLTTINFPTSLTTIERSAFEGCSSLSGILDLSNTSVQNIKARAFYNTSYTGAIFPTTLTTYGEKNYSAPLSAHLTTYKGLDNITTINSALFGNINNAIYMGLLQTTGYFPIVSSQDNGSNSPGRHSSVLQMYVPKFTNSSLTSFNGYCGALEQSLLTYKGGDGINETTIKLLYFRDILYIRRLDFYCSRIKNLVINNSTPPSFNTSATIGGDTYVNYSSWENTMFGTIPTSGTGAMTIYVPDSAVATYQADSNYNAYTIRGINEVDPNTNQPYLTRYATNALWEAAGKPEDALIEEYMN